MHAHIENGRHLLDDSVATGVHYYLEAEKFLRKVNSGTPDIKDVLALASLMAQSERSTVISVREQDRTQAIQDFKESFDKFLELMQQ